MAEKPCLWYNVLYTGAYTRDYMTVIADGALFNYERREALT